MIDKAKLIQWIDGNKYIFSEPYVDVEDELKCKSKLKLLNVLERDIEIGELDVKKPRPHWSNEEMSQLVHMFKNTDMSYREIGEKMNRTVKSCYHKLWRMGLIVRDPRMGRQER